MNKQQHTPGPCPYCREHHDAARGFTFDGHGVNGCDMYRSRLATISDKTRQGGDRIGVLFAAAPELLEMLIETIPYIEEGEEFEKPEGRRARPKLSRRVASLLARVRG